MSLTAATPVAPAATEPGSRRGRRGPLLRLENPRTRWTLAALVLLAAAALRFAATSPLWLDEAQSAAIASRPLPGLFAALRLDGAPPLYYLLLHGWIGLAGGGAWAMRALSGLLSLATVPALWWALRRAGVGRDGAWAGVLLFATSPFAVRYATETRMYALLMLLVVAGWLAWQQVWRRPGPLAAGGLAAVTAAALYTHYWALFGLAVVGVAALVAALRGSRPARWALGGLAVGAAAFAPWLPTFGYQLRHTGAPWGSPASVGQVVWAVKDWALPGVGGTLLAAFTYALVALALTGWPGTARTRRTVPAARPVARRLAAVAAATLTLGLAVGKAAGSAYAVRYSAVVFPLAVAVAAVGMTAVPPRWRASALAAVALTGLGSAVPQALVARTQAGPVARAVTAGFAPGDRLVVCPDQLGPALARLLPARVRGSAYPTGGGLAIVSWVDYETRNAAADPWAFARRVAATTPGRVWLDYATGYPTYGEDCSWLFAALRDARGAPRVAVPDRSGVFEDARLAVFPARR